MEKYKPTPGDFKKAEEMMSQEQLEMTRKREDVMENETELKEEIRLFSPQNKMLVTKNILEIRDRINEGYGIRTMRESARLRAFGIDMVEIKKMREMDKSKKLFELNSKNDLIYLKDGIDEWGDNVKNYWYNAKAYSLEESTIIGNGGLRAELIKNLLKARDITVAHQDSKDLRGLSQDMYDFLQKIKETGYDLTEFNRIFKYFTDNIEFTTSYMSEVLKNDYRNIAFSDIVFEDKSMKESHPLLAPFIEEIEKLEKEGQEKLPDWLAEQGTMAGYSADYLMIYDSYKRFYQDLSDELKKYNEFITEKGIKNAPMFNLPLAYMEKLEVINDKIHKVKKSN